MVAATGLIEDARVRLATSLPIPRVHVRNLACHRVQIDGGDDFLAILELLHLLDRGLALSECAQLRLWLIPGADQLVLLRLGQGLSIQKAVH